MIIAKFTCTNIRPEPEGEYVDLSAVTTGDHGPNDPNKSWSEYTPSGSVVMLISNPEARGRFEMGREYFLTFSPAE